MKENSRLCETVTQLTEDITRLTEDNTRLKEEAIKFEALFEYSDRVREEITKINNLLLLSDRSESSEDVPMTVGQRIDSLVNDCSIPQFSMMIISNVTVHARFSDHYVNALEMCQAVDKSFSTWLEMESTKELIVLLSRDLKLSKSRLIESGEWIHPDLAIQLAGWISQSIALTISRWIRSLDSKRLKSFQHRIQQLEDVCLSKKRRIGYKERNVVYLLTTDDHIKRRTYIVGKAKDLTTRLGTYNKTCEHTVVHYRECPSEEDMSTAETMILNRLREYREQSNRDRVILPADKDVSYFTSIFDQCVDFVKHVDND